MSERQSCSPGTATLADEIDAALTEFNTTIDEGIYSSRRIKAVRCLRRVLWNNKAGIITGLRGLAQRPFYGAECPSYPDCSGGCGLGCTKEVEHARGVAQASEDWHEDFRRRTRALSQSPDQRLTEDMTLAHNSRKTALREMADFFNESVHHVWSNDEIAACLTDMISASPVAGEETDDQIEERLAKQEARDNLRLLDYIADKIGIPHDEELSRETFNSWLSSVSSTPETTRNLVESLCEDCPKPQCLVCPRRAEGK